jgi:hypothetical protein
MRFVWANFPLFMIWLTGLGTLDTALHSMDPPLVSAARLTVIPLVITLVLLAFLERQGRIFRWSRYFPWALALIASYVIIWPGRYTFSPGIENQRYIYEISAIAGFLILAVHGTTWLNRWDWIRVFLVTLAFGMILENGGISMGFFREGGYALYLPGMPAPVATMVGWVNVLYCGFFAAEKILPESGAVWRGLVCAGIALSMDIPFDPVATRLSWWVWNPELALDIWGVPIVNYVAWFWAIFPYAAFYYGVKGKGKAGEGRKVLYLLGSFPVILAGELLGVSLTLALLGDKAAIAVIWSFFSSLGLQ